MTILGVTPPASSLSAPPSAAITRSAEAAHAHSCSPGISAPFSTPKTFTGTPPGDRAASTVDRCQATSGAHQIREKSRKTKDTRGAPATPHLYVLITSLIWRISGVILLPD